MLRNFIKKQNKLAPKLIKFLDSSIKVLVTKDCFSLKIIFIGKSGISYPSLIFVDKARIEHYSEFYYVISSTEKACKQQIV
jgi:hypothetical protein